MKSKGDAYFGVCTLPHSPKVSLEQGIAKSGAEVQNSTLVLLFRQKRILFVFFLKFIS